MHKYKISLIAIILMNIISSCGNNAQEIESAEAEKIPEVSANNNTVYQLVKEDCLLSWTAWHLGGIDPRYGKISYREAEVLVNNGKISHMTILMEMESITVLDLPEDGIKNLTDHLKSDDFFSVKTFPTSKFELTKLKDLEGDLNSEITGNLTILGITKSITFQGNILINDQEVSLKSQEFIINRADWGMTYNAKGTTGIPLDYLISDDVQFQVDISVLK